MKYYKLLLTVVIALMLTVMPVSAAADTDDTELPEIPAEETLSGSGTQNDPYRISSAADMRILDESVEDGKTYAGKYLLVTKDITLEKGWNGVGAKGKPFSGNFNGNNNTITIPAGGKALFAFLRDAQIHDLGIYGEKIADYGLVSIYTEDEGVDLVACFDHVTLKSGSSTLYSGFLGGYAKGSNAVLIQNCTIEENVTVGYDKSQSNIGGFAGEYNGTIENSVCNANVYGVNYVGGIAGNKGQSMSNFEIKNCTFSGKTEASGAYAGGIAGAGYGGTQWNMNSGWACRGVTIENCMVSGSVKGNKGVGGILGGEGAQSQAWENGPTTIRNNSFTGTVSGNSYVGGIIGYIISLNRYSYIEDNYYTSKCGAKNGIGAVGGIDTSGHKEGMIDTVLYFNSSTAGGKSAAEIRNAIAGKELKNFIEAPFSNQKMIISTGYKNQFRVDHNRTDDPLGADKENLCFTDEQTGITDFALKEKELEVPATKTVVLTPIFTPENADNKNISWKSSNEKVAAVDANGAVTGKVVGNVTITAVTEDGGKKATSKVRVLFSDVTDKTKAQFDAIYDLVNKGVIAGFKNGEYFAPNDQCTRAQVVLFLWRAAGKPDPKSTNLNFTDAADIRKLAPDYAKAIAWGNEQKIVMGFTSGANKGKFLPNDACTRAQIVLFLYRYKKMPATKATELTFTDSATIEKMAPAYTKAILWANETKVAGGYKVSGGYAFKPNQTCTRGECATFLYRALKLK